MAYEHWTLDDIAFDQIDKSKVTPGLLEVVKAAALVEFGGNEYAAHLCRVFADDPVFCQAARDWAVEEVQHGEALGRWAEIVDPTFNFRAAHDRFKAGYTIDTGDGSSSVRGSKAGELVARCMVETGTSSYYTAIKDAIEEPVLKDICKKIASDELRHYKLFYDHLKRYLSVDGLNRWQRLKIALGRIVESEDDELAYAFYAANAPADKVYDRAEFSQAYMRRAFGFYRTGHIDTAVAMIFKACGFSPQSFGYAMAKRGAWWLVNKRQKQLAKMAA